MKAVVILAFLGIASADLLKSSTVSELGYDNPVNEIPIYGIAGSFKPHDVKEVTSPYFHYEYSHPYFGKQSPLNVFPYPFYFNFPTFSDIFKGFPFFPFVRQPEGTSYYSGYVEPFSGGYYYQYPLGYRYVTGTSKTPFLTTSF